MKTRQHQLPSSSAMSTKISSWNPSLVKEEGDDEENEDIDGKARRQQQVEMSSSFLDPSDGRPLTPHLAGYIQSVRPAVEQLRILIKECATSKVKHNQHRIAKKLEEAAAIATAGTKKKDHGHHSEKGSEGAPGEEGKEGYVPLVRRLNDFVPPGIKFNKEFQELKSLKTNAIIRRRDAAERYLLFEYVGRPMSLAFDANRYQSPATKAAALSGAADSALSSKNQYHKKKRTALDFHMSEKDDATGGDGRSGGNNNAYDDERMINSATKTMFLLLRRGAKKKASLTNQAEIMGSDVDYPSAEVLLQRAFLLRAEIFGPLDERTEPTKRHLMDCYEGQGFDKEEELKELLEQPQVHMQRIRGRIEDLDKSLRAIKYSHLYHKVETGLLRLAKRAKERIRKRSLHEEEYEALMKAESMARASTTSPRGRLLVSSASVFEEEVNQDDCEGGEEEGGNQKANEVASKGGWYSTNRLGKDLRQSYVKGSSVNELIRHIQRADYVQTSESSRTALAKNPFDPPMQSIFRCSLVNMKQFPRTEEFQVSVQLSIPKDVIIGDQLIIQYDYTHLLDAERLHSPQDWVGIFMISKRQVLCSRDSESTATSDEAAASLDSTLMKKGTDDSRRSSVRKKSSSNNNVNGEEIAGRRGTMEAKEEEEEEEEEQLVAWKYVDEGRSIGMKVTNHGVLACELILDEGKTYRCRYHLAGSSCPVATSSTFVLRYPQAHLTVTESIICGSELRVSYTLDYQYSEHDPWDSIGILRARGDNDEEEPSLRACTEKQRLPKGNQGEVFFSLGLLCPGHYKICVFLAKNGNQVIGTSGIIHAHMEAYLQDHEKRLRQRDLSICMVGRWDMEGENHVLIERVLPQLKQLANNLYCRLNIVNLEEDIFEDGLLSSASLARLFFYIEHCKPFFIFCLGDQLGQHVELKSLDLTQFNLEAFPWLRRVPLQGGGKGGFDPTVTELLFLACFKLPILVSPQLATFCQFYFPDPRMRSKRHPSILSKGMMESLSLLNQSRIVMRGLKKEALEGTDRVTATYESIQAFGDLLLTNLTEAIYDLYPSEDKPNTGEYVAMLMDQDLNDGSTSTAANTNTIKNGFYPELSKYVRYTKPNGAIAYHPAGAMAALNANSCSIFQVLDKYLDDKEMETPLILVDRHGSGVSFKLATWIKLYLSKPTTHVLEDAIPQYGSCMSRVLVATDAWPHPRRRLFIYLNLEFLWHRMDTVSLLYYILYTMKKRCQSFFMNELPDPNTSDLIQDFHRWLEAVQGEQVILILDGMEYLRARTEDPICWIPAIINKNVRIIATTFPIGRVIYACDSEERKWAILRRRSELSPHERECIIHQFLLSRNVGLLKDLISPILKSDRMAYQLPLRTLVKNLVDGAPSFGLTPGLHEIKPPGYTDPDPSALMDFKTKVLDLLDIPDLNAMYQYRLRLEIEKSPCLKDALCLIRVAQRGLSELELVTALLKLQHEWECDSSTYLQKKKNGLAGYRNSTTQPSQGEESVQRTARSQRSQVQSAYRRKVVLSDEPLSKRFNRFRIEQWRILHKSLTQLTNKTMGVYVLHDRPMYRVIDTWYLDPDHGSRTMYLSVLIDMNNSELPSLKKATELSFLWYKTLRTTIRADTAAKQRRQQQQGDGEDGGGPVPSSGASVASRKSGTVTMGGAERPSSASTSVVVRPAVARLMEKLLEVLTDPLLFPHLYNHFHRSMFNEYMYQTGARDMEIYIKMTQRFEALYGITDKPPHGPKNYHIVTVPPEKQQSEQQPSSSKEKGGKGGGGLIVKSKIDAGQHDKDEGPIQKSRSLPSEAVRSLLLMGKYFFHHLRLYDAGQELLETALLALLQGRYMDQGMRELTKGLNAIDAKTAPLVTEVIYGLGKAYAFRFLAYYEDVMGDEATITKTTNTLLYQAYQALISRPTRSRTRTAAIKSTYELFVVHETDEMKSKSETAAEGGGTGGAGTGGAIGAASTGPDPLSMMKMQRTKLKMDGKKLHKRFQLMDQVMEKMIEVIKKGPIGKGGGGGDVVNKGEVQAIVQFYYPTVYDAFNQLYLQYEASGHARKQANAGKKKKKTKKKRESMLQYLVRPKGAGKRKSKEGGEGQEGPQGVRFDGTTTTAFSMTGTITGGDGGWGSRTTGSEGWGSRTTGAEGWGSSTTAIMHKAALLDQQLDKQLVEKLHVAGISISEALRKAGGREAVSSMSLNGLGIGPNAGGGGGGRRASLLGGDALGLPSFGAGAGSSTGGGGGKRRGTMMIPNGAAAAAAAGGGGGGGEGRPRRSSLTPSPLTAGALSMLKDEGGATFTAERLSSTSSGAGARARRSSITSARRRSSITAYVAEGLEGGRKNPPLSTGEGGDGSHGLVPKMSFGFISTIRHN